MVSAVTLLKKSLSVNDSVIDNFNFSEDEYNGQTLDLRKLYKAAPGKKSRDVICSVQVKTKSGIPCKNGLYT